MTSTTFIDKQTVIQADWLNDVNTKTYADTSNTVAYTPAGTGAVATTVQAKLQSEVSVYDFMTAAQIADSKTVSSTLDMTAAFTAAQEASKLVYIPPGFFTLNNFIHKSGVVFRGSGLRSTYILQGATGNPAWWCVSNATNNPVQNSGCELSGVWFLGKIGSNVSMCIVEATSPFIVAYSKFDIGGSDGFHTFEVKCPIAEVFCNKISVVQERHATPIGSFGVTGSYNTGVVINAGSYNEYYLNIAQSSNGKSVTTAGSYDNYSHLGTEGQVVITGQDNTILWAVNEGWTGPACDFVYDVQGTGNQFLDGPDVLIIPQSKVTGAAMQGPIDGTLVVNNLRVIGYGASLTLSGTLTAATSGTLTSAWTLDGTGVYKVDFLNSAIAFGAPLVAAKTGTLTANWTAASGTAKVTFSDGSIQDCLFTNGSAVVTWIKPVTATAIFTVKMTRAVTFTNGSTAISWTGAVTCGTTFSVIYAVPTAGMYLRSGSSGSITNADTVSCAYSLDTMPSGAVYSFPSAETYSKFTFQGDCSGLTNRGAYWNDGGTATFAAATTCQVTLTKPQPNASYRVALAPEANKTFWVTNKTQIGFTLNASSTSSDVVDWTVTQ